MTQPVNLNRVRKSLFLAALMLAPGVAVLAQPAQASVATCMAAIAAITVSRVYAEHGEVIRVTAAVIDTNPLPNGENNGQNTVSIKFTGTYKDNTPVFGPSGASAQGQLPEGGTSFSVDTPAIPADAAIEGLGTIKAEVDNQNDVNWCAETTVSDPTQIGCCLSRSTGFWVTLKADLHVAEGSLKLIRHATGDEVPGNNAHQNLLGGNEKVTRYPDVVDNANPANSCVEQIPPGPTGEGGNVSRAHFEFAVANDGTADFWGSAAGAPLPLTFRIRDGTTVLGTQTLQVAIAKGVSQVVNLTGINYTLVNRSGIRNVTIDVDSNGAYNETNELNNRFFSPADKAATGAVYILGPDLVPRLKDVVINSVGKAEGKFAMSNLGDVAVGVAPTSNNICRSRNGGPVFVRVYLDQVAPANEIKNRSDNLEPGAASPEESFVSADKVGAGQHKIIAVADAAVGPLADLATEIDELNNRVEFNVTVEDLKDPILSAITVPAEARTGKAFNITGFVTDDANFTLPGSNIFLDIVYPDNTNNTFIVPKQTLNNDTGTYSGFNVTDTTDKYIWQWHRGYDLPGDYTVRIRANDTVHEVLSQVFSFRLTDFTKEMSLVSLEVCRETNNITGINEASCSAYNETSSQPANLTFLGPSDDYNQLVRVRFKVPDNATGLVDEFKNATRKTVEVRDRDGRVLGNFTPIAICRNNLTGNFQEGNGCSGAGRVCEGITLICWVNTFQVTVGHGRLLNNTLTNPSGEVCQGAEQQVASNLTKPAQWNITFWIGDVGCKYRAHTPDLQPKPVKFRFGLWDTVNATVNRTSPANGGGVNARDPVTFKLDAYDNLTVLRTFARVLKGGQQVMLQDLTPTGNVNLNETSTRNGTYQKSFPTGIYTDLDQDGEYQFLLGAQDANLTISWNSANDTTCTPDYAHPNLWNGPSCYPVARTFRLNDRVRPTVAKDEARLVSALDGAIDNQGRDVFELTQTFVLQAEVDDDTRINVTAVLQSDAGVTLSERPMVHIGPATSPVYRTDNFTTGPGGLAEGTYRFLVRVVDSAGNSVDSPLRTIRVAGNLPPTFSQRSPPDKGYGQPSSTVGVDVSDAQGVVTSSVVARFGINVDAPNTPVANPVVVVRDATVRVSFQLPGTVKHGDKVVVSVSVSDGSVPPQNGTATWTFTVDGLAPRSTLTCTRSHPASCGSEGPQSVRGDTVFTLSAADADPENKAKSDVASVRFAVDVAGTQGQPQVVAGNSTTFRLGTFATQDGFYTLRFRAVDNAGNEEPERRLVFALDGQGPSIQNVVVTPTAQGWNLTATISDAASDVQAPARIFYRAGATEFREALMTKLPDTTFWFGNIPGARRGSQLCYYLEATDFLGNVASSGSSASPVCFASENHPPVLVVTSPTEGAPVVGSLTVVWQVSDIDGDPVTVSVAYRRSGDVQFTPVPVSTEEQGQRRKLVDTAGLVSGTYAVRVEAADNQPFNNRTTRVVNVTIGGDDTTSLVPRLDKTTVAPGEPVKVRIELARAASTVTAFLLRGEEVVQTKDMEQNPPGSRFWEAEFRITEPGTYQVEVRGEYENGDPFVIRAASALTVSGGGGLLDPILIGGLALAVVALAGLGLRRRGWL